MWLKKDNLAPQVSRKMQVSAQLNNLRKSPRKVRLVANMLKGIPVKDAEEQLKFLVKGSVPSFVKLLKSAVANAENNLGLDKSNLFIKDVIVNESKKLKRWLPRAHGRASLLLKRTSNVKIILEELVEGKGRKKVKKQEIKDIKGKPEISKKEKEKTEEAKEEKKEIVKERVEKEFTDEKKKTEKSKGFLKRVFRRKSM
jgi:large subunit ribosomal protein L22